MSSITTRAGKGTALTSAEVDANFTNLNADKAEQSITISAGAGLTGGGDLSGNRTLALNNSGVSAGVYGGNNSIPSLTIDAYGRVTLASAVTPTGTWDVSISGTAANASAVPFSGVSSKPTTLSGYGITDAQATLVSGTNIKTINGSSVLGSGNIQIDGGVTGFNTRTGAVTLSSGDVTTALGYTPYNSTNPSGYITSTVSGTFTVNGGSGIRALVDGSNSINSHLYFANAANNRAFNWQLDAAGNAATLFGYDGSTWARRLSIETGTVFFSQARLRFTNADADGGSFALLGLDWGGAPGTHKDFEVYDYVNGRAMFRSFGATRNFEVYGSISAASLAGGAATGTGASGTWGISITGNAATITSQANSATITASTTAGSANTIVRRDGNGYIFNNYFNSTDNSVASGVTAVMVKQGDSYLRSGTAASIASFISGQSMNIAGSATTLASGQSNWAGAGVLSNVVGLLGWKHYGNGHVIFDASNSTTPSGTSCSNTDSSNQWGATYPTLMGWNGSSTYGVRVDRARLADTVVNQSEFITKIGASYYQVNTWLQLNGAYGLYAPNNNGAHWHPNGSSSYGEWMSQGSKNGYSGAYLAHSAVNGMMFDGAGNGGAYREANGRWYYYHSVGNNCTGIGTSATDGSYSLYLDKGVRANSTNYTTGATYSSIYYDYNDAGYYCDPANNSRFFAITVGVGNAYSDIYMKDDEANSGQTRIHANSNIIGFLRGDGGQWFLYAGPGGAYATAFNNTSDYRLKNVVGKFSGDALSIIGALEEVEYTFIEDGKADIGYLAHQVQAVYPTVVTGEKDALKKDGSIDPQTIDYGKMVPLLSSGIKQLMRKIEALELEVAVLKGS